MFNSRKMLIILLGNKSDKEKERQSSGISFYIQEVLNFKETSDFKYESIKDNLETLFEILNNENEALVQPKPVNVFLKKKRINEKNLLWLPKKKIKRYIHPKPRYSNDLSKDIDYSLFGFNSYFDENNSTFININSFNKMGIRIKDGLNIFGICKNKKCNALGKPVVYNGKDKRNYLMKCLILIKI